MIEVMSADMVCVVRNVMADTLGSSETIENPPREYTEARKIEFVMLDDLFCETQNMVMSKLVKMQKFTQNIKIEKCEKIKISHKISKKNNI